MIITIDGPSGTGKSSVANGLARVLGIDYFDTGALYRALSWKLLQENVSCSDHAALQMILHSFSFRMQMIGKRKHYFVGDTDVTQAIRSLEVTAIVSEVSAYKEVRQMLMQVQKAFAQKTDAVFEGRDMGTVVFPQADFKFFLTATPEIRAQRRFKELQHKFPDRSLSLEETLVEMKERDSCDSTREIAPLKQAEDAILIDTSDLTVQEVVETMKTWIKKGKKT